MIGCESINFLDYLHLARLHLVLSACLCLRYVHIVYARLRGQGSINPTRVLEDFAVEMDSPARLLSCTFCNRSALLAPLLVARLAIIFTFELLKSNQQASVIRVIRTR